MDDLYYLSEIEKAEVEKFLTNKVQREAVRKVLLSGIYQDGHLEKDRPADPLKNFVLGMFSQQTAKLLPMEEKGKLLETAINAISLLESGFKLLEKCRKVEAAPQEENKNPGK